MKKVTALCLFLALSAGALLTSGCKNSEGIARSDTNFLGIVKMNAGSYEEIDSTTFDVHTSELYTREDISGDNIELLWGLVTIADY